MSREKSILEQSKSVLQHVVNFTPDSFRGSIAKRALSDGREIEHVKDLANQIMDHPRIDYLLFTEEIDKTILDLYSRIIQS